MSERLSSGMAELEIEGGDSCVQGATGTFADADVVREGRTCGDAGDGDGSRSGGDIGGRGSRVSKLQARRGVSDISAAPDAAIGCATAEAFRRRKEDEGEQGIQETWGAAAALIGLRESTAQLGSDSTHRVVVQQMRHCGVLYHLVEAELRALDAMERGDGDAELVLEDMVVDALERRDAIRVTMMRLVGVFFKLKSDEVSSALTMA